jgi:5'-methylthioadenosine phosphorylase
MAHVTDYDVWHVSEEPVSVEVVTRVLRANAELVQRSIVDLALRLPAERRCTCPRALEGALVTAVDQIPPETRRRLALLVDRYLPPAAPAY